MSEAKARQDQLTKPQGSLGVLEDLSIKLAGITRQVKPKIAKKVIIVMAGDHGVVEEGVSAFPAEVTPQMVMNFVAGGAGINVLSRHVGAEVVIVDIGVAAEINHPSVIQAKVRAGTANFAKEAAMSRAEAVQSILVGAGIAQQEIDKGATILGTGDMGIGNTTPSTAILSALTNTPPEEVCGYGTGIDDHGLKHKIKVINQALEMHKPDASDPIEVLSKVGGLEIGGLAGVILASAAKRIPIVIDGFISGAAALLASRLAPKSVNYMIASHVSVEPGHKTILNEVGLSPMLHMNMRLGEGTGAALGISVVEAASKIINEMATFSEASVSEKKRLSETREK
jgi:nicotinate-nucleotide--dimethylbenzimidazole phosphoribosyltransferase